MTKTIHPLLSHYSSTKWGEGSGAYSRGAYFKSRPIGGVPGGGAYSREGGRQFEDLRYSLKYSQV